MLTNLIIVLIILSIVAGAAAKLIIERKNGGGCAGCPYSGLGNQSCHSAEQPTCGPASKLNHS
jgi:hypothetical protein